ncbi:MAG: hypothetical protein A2Y77_01900 [Planctomycetes bacterium RBG_13_62_9]|nr:MAG: hypothetical protein A2Y77_01900 [Planctomycetes bacterium RBG_13_62_9]
MMRLSANLTAAATCVIVSSVVCQSTLGREVKLTIYPQKASATAGKWSLLPPEASLIDGDAAPLYDKAVKALPPEPDRNQGSKWLAMPVAKLPLEKVQGVLERDMAGLKGVARAVRCRECNWPKLTDAAALNAHFEELRRLRVLVQLWARYEIAQGNHEGAILAMRTGFGMARHVAPAPNTLQFTLGVLMAGSMCREVEPFVQTEDAPNLYAALAALPRPFVDVEKAIEDDKKATPSELPPGVKMTREQIESEWKASHDQQRLLAKGLERDLSVLQCIEAIRSYAASHGGQLPQTLADITEVSVPKDPINGAVFRYTRTGSTAVLESPAPPGGNERDAVRYEIIVKN